MIPYRSDSPPNTPSRSILTGLGGLIRVLWVPGAAFRFAHLEFRGETVDGEPFAGR
jgi:hypothetical protein